MNQRNDYLAHHGIKGMKWGIRRFRNTDGSLTNASKDRYYKHTIGSFYNKVRADNYRAQAESARKAKRISASRRYERLANKYQKKSDKAQAKYDAKHPGNANRERMTKEQEAKLIKRNLKIALGVSVAAAAAYVAHDKLTQEFCDKVIKDGTTIGRIDGRGGTKLSDVFWAARSQKDRDQYRSLFGTNAKSNEIIMEAKNGLKIASDRNARKTFEEIYNKDAEFRNTVNKQITDWANMAQTKQPWRMKSKRGKMMIGVADGLNKSKVNRRKLYDAYNFVLVQHNKNDKKFYDALRAKGYSGISDINDRKYAYNVKTKTAGIFFDRDKVNVKSAAPVKTKDIIDGDVRLALRELGTRGAARAGAVGAAGAATTYLSYANRNSATKRTNANQEKTEKQQTRRRRK